MSNSGAIFSSQPPPLLSTCSPRRPSMCAILSLRPAPRTAPACSPPSFAIFCGYSSPSDLGAFCCGDCPASSQEGDDRSVVCAQCGVDHVAHPVLRGQCGAEDMVVQGLLRSSIVGSIGGRVSSSWAEGQKVFVCQ